MAQSRRKILGAVLAVVILAMALYLAFQNSESLTYAGYDEIRELSEGWYRLEAGEKIYLDLPGRVELDGGVNLTICNDSLTAEDAGRTVYLRGAELRPMILAGDEPIYAYDDASFPRNQQMRAKMSCTGGLSADYQGQTLSIRYENPGDGCFDLPRVYVGSPKTVFVKQCTADGFTLLLVFGMLLIAVLSLIISLNLKAVHVPDPRFMDVSAFLVLCAAWCLLDSSLMQDLSGQSAAVCYLSFYTFMTFPIPVLNFVRNTGNMRRFRSLDIWSGLFFFNALAQGLLRIAGAFEFIELLWVTHVLLFAGVGHCSALMLREYRQNRSRDLRYTLLAFFTLAASGVLAMLLYWVLGISYYGAIFEAGIIVFIVCLLCAVISDTADNLRFRIEAKIYQRLSQQDGLTGLANRRGFDKFMEELEGRADEYEDVALVFMDLNGLKHVNDVYGHSAGDELIISAARCIEKAFADGKSYRIGGDEFAAILVNPSVSVAKYLKDLDDAIDAFNLEARYKLSIARGFGLLRDADGHIKRLSDWKYEADQAMYRNKKHQKQAASNPAGGEEGAYGL